MAPPLLKDNLKVACPSQPPGGRNGTHSLRGRLAQLVTGLTQTLTEALPKEAGFLLFEF